jgi:alpha-tubulin suppressor-like RCC1 family protein
MVLIDAAPALRAQIEDVHVTVASGARGAAELETQFRGSLTRGAGIEWPLELAILPREGDVTREYLVTAAALDGAREPLVTLRARSGFVRGRTLSLVLLFDAACVADPPECDGDHSCVGGRCAAAYVDPSDLPDYALDARGVPIATPRKPGPFAPQPDASADGMDAAVMDASRPDAGETDEVDAALDAGAATDAAMDGAADAAGDAAVDTEGPLAVTTGDHHTCVLLADRAVKCWGRNLEGELGLGHQQRLGDGPAELGDALPAIDFGERTVAEVAAGGLHSCARFEDSTVACWGENRNGGLGLGLADGVNRGDVAGEMGDALLLVDLGADFTAAQLAASWTHTCARSSAGAIKCWGTNLSGLLGVGDISHRGDSAAEMGDALPAVELGALPADDLVAGDYHSCARFEGGRIKCWGSNYFSGGENARGDQPAEMGEQLPFVELGTGLTVLQLSAGGYHMCARLSDERIKCWGDNEYGQLGQADSQYRGHEPTDMGDDLPAVDLGRGLRAVQLVSGRQHNCALFDDGRVKCWGGNDRGQLGLGDTDHRGDAPFEMGEYLPFVDLGPDTAVAALATQENHTCAVLVDGRIKCWGANEEGQLGVGDLADRGDEPGEMGAALPPVDVGGR